MKLVDSETKRGEWTLCLVGLTLLFLEVWVANNFAYPRYLATSALSREVVSTASVATYIALALINYYRPTLLSPQRLSTATLCMLGCGTAGLIVASIATPLASRGAALLIIFGSMFNIGRAIADVLVGLALMRLSARGSSLCIVIALSLSYIAKEWLSLLPCGVGYVCFVALPYLQFAACKSYAAATLIRCTAQASEVSIRDLSVTNPRSLIPFSHRFFIAIFVFRVAFGFSLAFRATDGVPPQSFLSVLPLVIILAQLLFARNSRTSDILYEASTMLVLAGFLAIIAISSQSSSLPNALLTSGSDCFRAFVWFACATIGRRNPGSGFLAISWSLGSMGIATIGGNALGTFATQLAITNSSLSTQLIALLIFLFVGFNIVTLHNFSFDKTFESVEEPRALRHPYAPTEKRTRSDTEIGCGAAGMANIEPACRKLARMRHLTDREFEILLLLARGRNVPFIQEALTVSHNTVRTHVRHIYQKLDVHSQQELIDIVELELTR